jgi:hypothetical protein
MQKYKTNEYSHLGEVQLTIRKFPRGQQLRGYEGR